MTENEEEFRMFCKVAGHADALEIFDRFLRLTPEQREGLRQRFVEAGLAKAAPFIPMCDCG